MHKNRLIIIIIFVICFAFIGTALMADKHSEEEVKVLIKDIENKLGTIKEEGAENYAGKEISKIEQFIKNAKKYLDDGDEDPAFFEISKGKAYFKLIEAKKELLNAETELKNTQARK